MEKRKSKKPWGMVIAMLVVLMLVSYLLYFIMIYKEQGLPSFLLPDQQTTEQVIGNVE